MEDLLNILRPLHPHVDFENCDTLIDSRILDSFDIVAIISEVEDQFGVVIGAENITPDNFNSAQALYALICRLEDED